MTAPMQIVSPDRKSAVREWLERLARSLPFDRRLLLAGLIVGTATGLAAVAFHRLLDLFAELRDALDDWPFPYGIMTVIFLPAIGGALSGWLTRRRYPEAGGHGVAEVVRALDENDGHISAHVAWVKSLASAATIGFGGSAGLEGPIVQIGSSVGSAVGRLFAAPVRDLRTFVAAGAVGGLSAAFGLPLAGVFFTMEVILKDFANEAFPAVVVSSVIGATVARSLLRGEGMAPFLAYEWTSARELLFYTGLGLFCGFLGRNYSKVLHKTEIAFDRLERIPRWLYPGIGGLMVGAFTVLEPRVAGSGRATISELLSGQGLGWRAPLLVLAKFFATALTLGSGGSGGALMPALFIGAAAGSAWGHGWAALGQNASNPGAFALAGLCAVFAAAFSAPVTGILIGIEMTRDYGLVVPVMICCVAATLGSRGSVEPPRRPAREIT